MRTITHAIIEQIRADAVRSDTEICGALVGHHDEILAAVSLPNASEAAHRRFFIRAADVLRIELDAERAGHMLMGFYHSHPHGDAVPSSADLQQALPGYVYWIASRSGEVRAWQLREDRSAFDEVEIT